MQAAQGPKNGTIQEFSISKSDIFFKVLDNKLFYNSQSYCFEHNFYFNFPQAFCDGLGSLIYS